MVVYRVRKVIGGYSVRLQNNDVLIVFGDGDFTLYRVFESNLVFDTAL